MKMKTILGILLLPCAALADVPDVDLHGKIVEVKPARMESNGFRYPAERVRMIYVNGKQMTLLTFIKTYCLGDSGATCKKARQLSLIETGRGPKNSPRS